MAIKRMGLGFSALVLALSAVVLPVNGMVYAEGDASESTETAESVAVASVATYEELKAALANKEVSTVKLTADIEASALTWITRGVTIDGQGHTFTSTAAQALLTYTKDAIVLKDLTVVDKASGSIAVYIYTVDFDVTLDNVTVNSNGKGVYFNGNPSAGKLTIENSTLEWIDVEGNAVADPTKDHSGLAAAYGLLSPYGFGASEITIRDSQILGYRYGIISYGDVAGAKLNITNSKLADWTNVHIYGAATESNPMTIKISNSELYGTNKFSGSSNTYANLIIEKGTYGETSYLAKYINLEVTDSEMYAYATKDSDMRANQYAVMNRAAGSENTNTVKLVNTNFSLLGDFESQKAQNSNFQNEPTWASDEYEEKFANGEITLAQYQAYFDDKTPAEMRADRQLEDGSTKWIALTDWAEEWDSYEDDPALSGITVESGIFAYNPKGFTAEGAAIKQLADGTYQVYMETGYSSEDETTGRVTTYATLDEALESDAAEIFVDKDTEVETLSVPYGKTLTERDGAVTVKNTAESEINGKFVKQDGKSYHVIKTSELEHGSLAVSVVSGTSYGALVAAGSDIDLTAEAEEGYEPNSIYWISNSGQNNNFSFTMPDEDIIVGAYFNEINTTTYEEALAAIVPGQSMNFNAPEDSKIEGGIYYYVEGMDESELYEGTDAVISYEGEGVWTFTTTEDLPEGNYSAFFYSEKEDVATWVMVIVDKSEDKAMQLEGQLTAQQIAYEYLDVLYDEDATEEEKAAAYAEFVEHFDNKETADKVLAGIEDGKDIDVEFVKEELDAEDVDKDVLEALTDKMAKDGFEEYAENMTFYDLSFDVTVDGQAAGKLTQLGNAVRITLAVDNDVADGYARKYIVVRYHDGSVEVLDSIYNEEDGTVTFESDKFSTYALAYLDELTATPDTGRFTASQSAASNAAIMTTIASMIVLAGAAGFAIKRR